MTKGSQRQGRAGVPQLVAVAAANLLIGHRKPRVGGLQLALHALQLLVALTQRHLRLRRRLARGGELAPLLGKALLRLLPGCGNKCGASVMGAHAVAGS